MRDPRLKPGVLLINKYNPDSFAFLLREKTEVPATPGYSAWIAIRCYGSSNRVRGIEIYLDPDVSVWEIVRKP